jgi:ketopantoate reductase
MGVRAGKVTRQQLLQPGVYLHCVYQDGAVHARHQQGDIMHAGAYKDARPIKVMLAEEVPPGANILASNNVGVKHELDPSAAAHFPQQARPSYSESF